MATVFFGFLGLMILGAIGRAFARSEEGQRHPILFLIITVIGIITFLVVAWPVVLGLIILLTFLLMVFKGEKN